MRLIAALFFIALITSSCEDDPYYNQQTKGVEIYLDKNPHITDFINPDNFDAESEPFITYNEITSYDSATHVMEFTKEMDSIFFYWNNHDGRGFGVFLDDSIMFCGILWSPIHSDPNENIVLTTGDANNKLQFIDCYPEGYFQTENRINDDLIIERFKKDGKLISF